MIATAIASRIDVIEALLGLGDRQADVLPANMGDRALGAA
jgi:hypothetical protein